MGLVHFTILSFNVQGYQRADPQEITTFIENIGTNWTNGLARLARLAGPPGPNGSANPVGRGLDIICLQEHVDAVELQIKGFKLISLCAAERIFYPITDHGGFKHLANAIYVSDSLLADYEISSATLWLPVCRGMSVPRGAAILTIDNITIANMHLSGGAEDDIQRELGQIKAQQIERVATEFSPDIIVGDLNSESNEKEAKETFKTYEFYRSLEEEEREEFMKYYLSGHERLHLLGYHTILSERMMRPTSIYGGVPDWVYTKISSKCRVIGFKKFIAIPRLSDHDAILTTIESSILDRSRGTSTPILDRSRGTSIELSILSDFFHTS